MAIAYDFDGTLIPGNMQERGFIPSLKLKPKDFWAEVKVNAREHDMDETLAYLNLMLRKAQEKDIPINRQAFVDLGKTLEYFPGVDKWFGRINKYAKNKNIELRHYVISSGLREIIEGTSIFHHFTMVYASGFRYDVDNVARWPALAINYTSKTQYLFRINKGIENSYDNSTINKFMAQEDRPVPFKNMVYIGDGDTDIPAMRMMTHQGGRTIAVYPPKRRGAKQRALKLIEEQRADVAVLADYSEGKALDRAVKAAIDSVSADHRFRNAGK